MLSVWNDENVNQVGPTKRGLGGGKSLKTLGDAGSTSSENLPSASGKGMLKQQQQQQQQQQQRKLKPLGSYTGNAPPSAAKGKAGGLGGLANSASKPQPLKQRRALVDISNAGKAPAAGPGSAGNAAFKLPGKQRTPGLKFTVHSDSRGSGTGAAAPSKSAKAAAGGGSFKSRVAARGRSVVGPDGCVDDVEMLLGRTGDEEEVLVERKMEQRAALKYAKSHGHSASAGRSARRRSRSTAPSFPKATSRSRSKAKFGRDITNTAAASAFGGRACAGADAGADDAIGGGVADRSLDSAIECILRDDFEDKDTEMGGEEEEEEKKEEHDIRTTGRTALEEPDLDMEAVAMALEALEEDSCPLGLLDDHFSTQDLELDFA
ncbi:unnamed protein product [Hapterophycus canaliculatus]